MKSPREKLEGIDRERLFAALEPVLCAHGVELFEIAWGRGSSGRVLSLSVERPNSALPGEGITIDLCTEISRDLSAALDVSGLFPSAYRLEVGSPGLERALYGEGDYQRFVGWLARLKVSRAEGGATVVRGRISRVSEGEVVLAMEQGELELEFERIEGGRLVFDWDNPGMRKQGGSSPAATRPQHRDVKGRAAQRSK